MIESIGEARRKQLKVVMVDSDMLPVPAVLGGAIEETLENTVRSIKGHDLTVISRFDSKLEGLAGMQDPRFRHVDIKRHAKRTASLLGRYRPPGFRDPRQARSFHYLNGVAELLLELKPDVIQVHNRPEFLPFVMEQVPTAATVLYMHNEFDYRNPRVAEALPKLSHGIFVSDFLRKRFLDRFPGLDAARFTTIHNGVDTALFHPDRRKSGKSVAWREAFTTHGPLVLFVGRTVPQKGIHHLIDAFSTVLEKIPSARMLVAGSPLFAEARTSPFHREIERRAAKLGGAVEFLGFVPHELTPYLYGAADLMVAPSVWPEPFGKVVVEAMASGLPVVTSSRGGLPEIVADGSGEMVDDPADTNVLATTILDLLGDRGRRSDLSAKARMRALHFDEVVRIRRLERFYDSLMGELRV